MIRFVAVVRTAVTVLAIVIGGPILLTAIAGPPIPRHWPSATQIQAWLEEPLNPGYATGTARAFAWAVWAVITAVIAADIVARLGRLCWPALAGYLPRPTHGLTAALLGTAAITTTITGTAAPAVAATPAHDSIPAEPNTATTILKLITTSSTISDGPHTSAPEADHREAAATTPARAGHDPNAEIPPWARNAPGGTHRVVDGDTLWDIAEHQLGDPLRWHEIYRLNHSRPQIDGTALRDPDEIRIGWILALPARHHTDGDREPPERTHEAKAPRKPATDHSAELGHPAQTPAATAPGAASSTVPAIGRPNTPVGTDDHPAGAQAPAAGGGRVGVTLPSQGWVSLGLAATIAALSTLLRLRRRRMARLTTPIPVHTGATAPPVPAELAVADAAGRRDLKYGPANTDDTSGHAARPATPGTPAPVGVDAAGADVSLFTLTTTGVALDGPGALPAARAILASTLATNVLDAPPSQPIVVTSIDTLTRLLPDGGAATGLDPHRETFDGERLIVLADTGNAVTHAEEELIARRRLLDTFDAPSVSDLNARTDHAEAQPRYLLLVDADTRNAGRLAAVAGHATALHLHVVVLGPTDAIPTLTVAADGTITTAEATQPAAARLATLAPSDLAHLLAMISEAAPRPEPGTDIDADAAPTTADEPNTSTNPANTAAHDPIPDLPTMNTASPALARLCVLGPITITTDSGPITTGMRSGSYAVLALLAAHPRGRTLDQLAADLHPDTDRNIAVKRVRTDINTARRIMRSATDAREQMFIHHDPATGRYRLDPNVIEVDLWRMLTAIGRANTATDDTTALAALHEAADQYGGDFADGQDRAWITDYATTPRLQILGVYARIAELLETDQPDAAVAALEQALRYDPVNEELYQRIMRIHGRQHRPDAVRRTLRRLENQLADLGAAEPSEATVRLANRQLRPATTGVGA